MATGIYILYHKLTAGYVAMFRGFLSSFPLLTHDLTDFQTSKLIRKQTTA